MAEQGKQGGVQLAGRRPASAVFHEILANTVAAFPDALGGVDIPDTAKAFRKGYAQFLPQLEAARLRSADRLEIARHMVAAMRDAIVLEDAEGQTLREALREPAEVLPLKARRFSGPAGWQPSLIYQGRRWPPEALGELGRDMYERGLITGTAAEAFRWAGSTHALDLTGRKVAVLGAGAEMAPTRFWLEAGADVLWLDTAAPPDDWLDSDQLAGHLYWPRNNVDLLEQPKEILATLLVFADGKPMDLGLYAYAPGQARELRLTGAMNALVEALPPELVSSVTMLVSPTTPTVLATDDIECRTRRLTNRPKWESRLARMGALKPCDPESAVSPTVVTIQGASYQAAQYLAKVLTAECWFADADFSARISANTAAITRTRSLDHPVFAAAFGGAAAFGVETFPPRLSRQVNGLLAVHDWLCPEPPVPGEIRVHGGIHTLPYPLESALQVAAAIGFAKSPRLLKGLFRAR